MIAIVSCKDSRRSNEAICTFIFQVNLEAPLTHGYVTCLLFLT